jgi:hypothetical protein
MQTFDGVPIEIGMLVYLLQVPVMRQHEFKIGKVEKITAKTVHVRYAKDSRWQHKPEDGVEKRYPDQLIAVKG